jgi:putative ABC transport system substrate-binding protein
MHGAPIISAAARNNVPAIFAIAGIVRNGGLLSYGFDQADNFRRAASYVKAAKALGLEVPLSIRVRADEVIE